MDPSVLEPRSLALLSACSLNSGECIVCIMCLSEADYPPKNGSDNYSDAGGYHQDRIRSQTPKKAFKRALEERKVVRLSVAKACHLVGISRQAYYQRLTAETNQTNQHQTILQLVREQRMVQPRVGTRKLHYMLKVPMAEHRIKMGRDALFNLLRLARLLVLPKRAYHKTTHSHHRFYKHPNLLKSGALQVTPSRPEEVWVADITYLPTQTQNTYLSLVTDAYSRKIVGYHVDTHMQTSAVSKALKMAVSGRPVSYTHLDVYKRQP